MDPYILQQHIKIEKTKARELRQTHWWKQQIGLGICHICHQKFAPKELTMDHLIPVSRGGKSSKKNVKPACRLCNLKKSNQLQVEITLEKIEE